MLDILRLARLAMDLLLSFGQPLTALVAQPLMTVSILLALYAGWHVRDEGSLLAGLEVAFVDTKAYRVEHLRELESTILQAELRQVGESDRLINQLLTAVLQHNATAARVRLGVVHDGVTGITGIDLLRYDITHAVASPGHAPGEMVQDRPLSEWSEFFAAIISGQCLDRNRADVHSPILRSQLDSMGAGAFLVCPVVDIEARMLGALFITWDNTDHPPVGEEMLAMQTFTRQVATQVATALDLRTRLPGTTVEPKP